MKKPALHSIVNRPGIIPMYYYGHGDSRSRICMYNTNSNLIHVTIVKCSSYTDTSIHLYATSFRGTNQNYN